MSAHPLIIAPLEALTDTLLTDPERRVLFALYSFRGKDTNTVWPSVKALAERAHFTDHTRISKLTSSLSDKGWLTKKRRGFTGGNSYVLTVPERLANLDSAANLDAGANMDSEANTNLDSAANLADPSNLDPDTSSNLDSAAKSNLDSAAKYKEQTIEQTIEQDIPSDISDETSPTQPKRKPVPFQKIVDLYHETLPGLPRCEELTEARRGAIRQRHQNNLGESLDNWRNFFEYVADSPFLTGRIEPRDGQRPFRANLEWITKQGNYVKIKEGRYHGG